jgi:hypothetical protein
MPTLHDGFVRFSYINALSGVVGNRVAYHLQRHEQACNSGLATATGLSAMLDGEISHDKITRFISGREYTSKDLWKEVKSAVRQIEREDGCLIFDDTIQEKAWPRADGERR